MRCTVGAGSWSAQAATRNSNARTANRITAGSLDRGEGDIAGPLARLADENPDLSFGSYPFQKDGKYGSNVVIRGTDAARIAAIPVATTFMLPDGLLPYPT